MKMKIYNHIVKKLRTQFSSSTKYWQLGDRDADILQHKSVKVQLMLALIKRGCIYTFINE